MLTYTFSSTDTAPLYQQLYRFIREDIAAGVLAAGVKLPSKRNFAKNLGISTITVENAYEQLIAEGYLYTLPRKGFFVTDIGNGLSVRRERIRVQECGVRTKQKKYLADFTSIRPARNSFPFPSGRS